MTDKHTSSEPYSKEAADTVASTLYGRTNSGKVFPVPKTTDMLTTLFTTSRKRSFMTSLTLAILALELGLFFILPSQIKKVLFLGLFLFWRVGYNGFLGFLLQNQSNRGYIVRLLSHRGFLDDKYPWGKWAKSQLSGSMGSDYDFNQTPPEFNAWLLFRELVDLILVNDFSTYLMFALSNFQVQSNWSWWENTIRYSLALLLMAFNLAVKVDAHRVVKDFAWYWGDFFFLVDQSLIFDGVFDFAPHPMYSVGYAGYYGISILTASPTVFYISLLAHAAQFIFLIVVENPHIEKTYSTPTEDPTSLSNDGFEDGTLQSYIGKDFAQLVSVDLHRAPGLFSLVVFIYGIGLPLISFLHNRLFYTETFMSIIVLGHALIWRIFYTLGLGFGVLGPQSTRKTWTRHFIKTGGTPEEAFSHWQSIYSLSSSMTYISFGGAALYHIVTENWSLGSLLLRFTCGSLLIVLHLWTSISVLEELGTFGWSYGDFFLDPRIKTLRYTGIYRYLNNPEKVLGQAALYGLALISYNHMIFALAVLSHLAHLAVHYKVEIPHMRSLYRGPLRSEAGVTKTVKGVARHLTANLAGARALAAVKGAEALVDRVGNGVDQVLTEARARIPDIVGDTQTLLTTSKERLAETRKKLIQDLVENSYLIENNTNENYELELTNFCQEENDRPARYTLGEPITLRISVPSGSHHCWDWIGLYPVVSNPSKLISTVSSKKRFLYSHPPPSHFKGTDYSDFLESEFEHEKEFFGDIYERTDEEAPFYSDFQPWSDSQGFDVTLKFTGLRLPWTPGTYEFRCHRGPGHGVACISRPLEIVLPSPLGLPSTSNEVVSLLEPHLARCLEVETIPELFNLSTLTKSQATRMSLIIKALFQVEFVYQVISSHTNLSDLGQRILDARAALAPFSLPSTLTTPSMPPRSDSELPPILN